MSRLATVAVLVLIACAHVQPDPEDPAITRGIGFLAEETPRWKIEHRCYSCHNNGDAARALYMWAQARGADDPIADTSAWLQTSPIA